MRVAVVGSGIAGMASAWLISQTHDVDLFESAPVLGGHTHTVDISVEGRDLSVDTGFMVFNERTYPNLVGLLRHLGIESQESDMSFGVHCGEQELEWSSARLVGLLAQPSNILRAELWRMVYDMVRLSASSDRLLAEITSDELTLGGLLEREGYSRAFIELYLIPMVSAIWSTPTGEMLNFPARTFLRFADNHGLLHITGKPRWRTVPGGARRYVRALASEISGSVNTGLGATSLSRSGRSPELTLTDGSVRTFDRVVLACHAPQSLALLADPNPAEREILGAFAYQPNEAVLHTGESFLPTRKLARASWNYHAGSCELEARDLAVTYYLNRLQGLAVDTPVLLTLNPDHPVREDLVLRKILFEHPVFGRGTVQAQDRLPEIQGERDTWYCGAWQRYGFHEDGLLSALRVATDFDARAPWTLDIAQSAGSEQAAALQGTTRERTDPHVSPTPGAEPA